MAIGVPGWPELAAWTASMDRVRIVLMQVASSGWRWYLISGLLSTATVMDVPLKDFGPARGPLWGPRRLGCRFYRGSRAAIQVVRSARRRLRVVPAADVGDHLDRLGGTPGVRFIFEDGGDRAQHRVDDPPRLLHVIFPREQGGIALHGLAQQPLVCAHLVAGRVMARQQLLRPAGHGLLGAHDHGPDRDRHVGVEAEPEIVGHELGGREDRRWPAELGEHLGAREGQILAGPDGDGDTLPAPGMDLEPQGGEGLDLRVGGDPLLVAVAPELPADDPAGVERSDG